MAVAGESLMTAFVEIRADTAPFEAQVRSAATSLPPVPMQAAISSESVGTSATQAVERAAPQLQTAGRAAGEHAGKGFGESFRERVKVAFEFAAGYAGVATITDFLRTGIDQNEKYARSVNLINQEYGAQASAVTKASDATAHALGATQAEALNATGQFGAVLNQLGTAPDKIAGVAASLNTITAQLATRSSEDFATAQTQIQQFIETGQGRGLAKYLGRVSAEDIQAEARKLGLGSEKDHTTAVRDATQTLADAQDHLNTVRLQGHPTAAQTLKLNNDLIIAQDNLTLAHERYAAGKAGPQAVLAAENALAAARKASADAQTPADALALSDALNKVADAQDKLTASQKDSALTLTDQQRSLAIIGLLQERSTQLPPAAPTASTRLRDDFADIARVATTAIVPMLDKFAGFLDQHGEEIGKDIAVAFTVMGNTLQFMADHKEVFLEIAGAFAIFHELNSPNSILNKLGRDLGIGGGAGGIAGTVKGVATMTVEAGVVNVIGKGGTIPGLPGGGGTLPIPTTLPGGAKLPTVPGGVLGTVGPAFALAQPDSFGADRFSPEQTAQTVLAILSHPGTANAFISRLPRDQNLTTYVTPLLSNPEVSDQTKAALQGVLNPSSHGLGSLTDIASALSKTNVLGGYTAGTTPPPFVQAALDELKGIRSDLAKLKPGTTRVDVTVPPTADPSWLQQAIDFANKQNAIHAASGSKPPAPSTPRGRI